MAGIAQGDSQRSSDRFWLGPVAGLVLLILLGSAYYLLTHTQAKPKLALSLVPTTVNEMSSLTFHAQNKALTLYQTPNAGGGTAWHIGSPTGTTADDSLVGNFVGGLITLTPTRTVTSNPTGADLKAFGLAPPASSVAIARSNAQPNLQIDVGAQSPVGGYYLQVAGTPTVYLVDGMVPAEISADPNAWLPIPTTPSSTAASSSVAAPSAATP